MRIIEERASTGGAPIKAFFGNGQLRDGTTGYYYATDHLGSLRDVTNSAGSIVARFNYDPYGNVTQTEGVSAFDFLYTGHFFHSQSGLYLAPYRAYSPTLGRWLSPEPLGLDGPNPYHYVFGSPLDHLDPTGLETLLAQEQREALGHGGGRTDYFDTKGNQFEKIKKGCEGVKNFFSALLDLLTCGGKAAAKGVTKADEIVDGMRAAERSPDDFAKQASEIVERSRGQVDERAGEIYNMANKRDIKQINDVQKQVGLSDKQREILHDQIHGEKKTWKEIVEIAEEIKTQYPNR